MARVWAVANQKGGVGKTTTAIALAGVCAQVGMRTLMIDLDPHGSLTRYLGFDVDAAGEGVYELFHAQAGTDAQFSASDFIHASPVEGLALMPASAALATLDRQLGSRPGMGLVLKQALAQVQGGYERVFIDCPPMLGVLMVNALVACEQLLIPTQTEFLALGGLDRMLRSLAMIERSQGRQIPHRIVPTLFDGRTRASQSSLDSLRATYAGMVTDAVIPTDTQVREASRMGVPPTQWAPARRAGDAYRQLLAELDPQFSMPEQRGVA